MKTFCTYYNKNICRSCSLIELDYLDQLKSKETLLVKHLGMADHSLLLPTIASKKFGARNKAKLSVTGTIENPIIGLIGESDKDQGREILDCPLHHSKINEVILYLKDFIHLAKISPYSIHERRGELKGLILFYSETSDEMYLRFILRSKESITRLQKYLPELTTRFYFLKCISTNIQPIPHVILEGEEEIFLTERKFIFNALGDYRFEIDPKAFVQTNQEMAHALHYTSAQWMKDIGPKKFAELFCGQGAFSFYISSIVKEGLGIEINREAVMKANQMANDLGLNHMHFKCKDASSVESELNDFSPDLVLVNPPRKGLGKSIQLLTSKTWPYVIYSSCSYETLGKDLEILKRHYNMKRLQIFDMFPHTDHFETLVLLEKK